MINWMQKHKKSLIPTIWISGIAFIGAGFVGWGSYDYNKDRSTSIAKVGDTPISLQEFSQKHNEIYSYLFNISDGKFSKEEADNMNLNEIVVNELIQNTMLLNFAKDLGIDATDEDVARYIYSMHEFQSDGKFDRNLYEQTISYMGIKHSDFEKIIKKTVIIDKLNHAINLSANDNDVDMLLSAYFMQDNIKVKVIKSNTDDVKLEDGDIRNFWEKNKNLYISPKSYEISYFIFEPENVNVDEDKLKQYYEDNKNKYLDIEDKILEYKDVKQRVENDFRLEHGKDEALKVYIELKNNSKEFDKNMIVKENSNDFPVQMLQNQTPLTVIKPFVYQNNYIIAKINKINEPRPMDYDLAKDLAKADLLKQKTIETLQDESKKILQTNFEGINTGFVNRDSNLNIAELNESETKILLNTIFDNNDIKGYVMFDNKVAVYEILEQKLTNDEKKKEYLEILKENAKNVKITELRQELLNQLTKRYKVEKYYKGEEVE